jgi:hypothetical protein
MSIHKPPRRAKVSVSVDAGLLAVVDRFVATQSGVDRSGVFDVALGLWYADQLDSALTAQYAESDDVDPIERTAWNVVRAAAARRALEPEDRVGRDR